MYLGDYAVGSTVRFLFNTQKSDGTPITLAGTPSVTAYKDASTTQVATGATLTVDFDSVTGMHLVAIDTSADATFYAAGSDFSIVLAAGTVDSVSQVGVMVGNFSLANRTAALIASERTAIGTALLDLAAGIETGLTLRQALRLLASAEAGKLSGAATATVVIRNAVADSKDRITATVDASGNRSAITYDLT